MRLRNRRGFYLVNLLLILLYAWSLSELSTFEIQVAAGECTAILPERTLAISCPDFSGGQAGLFLASGDTQGWEEWPGTRWQSLALLTTGGQQLGQLQMADPRRPLQWLGELWDGIIPGRHQAEISMWRQQLPASFILRGRVNRASDSAGIILTDANRSQGKLFLVSAADRRGVWWEWAEGEPISPILGAPFQKSFQAQTKTLLRQILTAHHAALALLAAGWLLARFLTFVSGKFWQRREQAAGKAGRGTGPAVGKLRERLLLSAAILLTFGGSLHVSLDLLDGIPHVQDSVTYLFQAKTLARGQLYAPAPPDPAAFEQEFMLVNQDRWYGKYTPGFPLLLAGGVRAGAPWLVNPLLAMLSIPLFWLLGKHFYGREGGYWTVLLAATSPFFLIMSGTFMAHAAELFWVLLFMVAWLRGLAGTRWKRWVVLAGVALAMVFLTRQVTALLVGIPFTGITWQAQARALWPASQSRKVMFQRLAWLLGAALPGLLLLLAYQWQLTGQPLTDPRLQFWEHDQLGFGEDIGLNGNVFHLTPVEDQLAVSWFDDPDQPPRGHSPARGLYNTLVNWQSLQVELFGWPPFITLGLAALGLLLWRTTTMETALPGIWLAVTGLYVAYWASGIMYGPRYFYAVLPALLLLTVRGIQGMAAWLEGDQGLRAARLLVLLLVAGNILFFWPLKIEQTGEYNFVSGEPLATVRALLPAGSSTLLLVGGEANGWWDYGQFFSANSPWLDGPLVAARDPGPQDRQPLVDAFPDRNVFIWPDDFQAGEISQP